MGIEYQIERFGERRESVEGMDGYGWLERLVRYKLVDPLQTFPKEDIDRAMTVEEAELYFRTRARRPLLLDGEGKGEFERRWQECFFPT